MLKFIDSHTHLFAKEFDGDRAEVVQSAIDSGVTHMMLPNIDLESIESMKALSLEYPNHCLSMIGIHPCSVSENLKSDLKCIESELNSDFPYYGIGETGLDYFWDKTFINEQKESLRAHAELAKAYNLPIVLHTRDSMDDNLTIMREAQDGNLRGVFHCFGGSLKEAREIIDLGFYLGIGGVVTFKNSGAGLREALKGIPLSSIVLETDSPYLSPVPHRGKRNESSYLLLVAEKLAEALTISIEEVAVQTSANSRTLFGLD